MTQRKAKNRWAIVLRDGYKVPLIGVPEDAALERCDRCCEMVALTEAVLCGDSILCLDCNSSGTHRMEKHAPGP